MLVTTSYEPENEVVAKARLLAAAYGGAWVPRRRDSLSRLMKAHGQQDLLLVTKEEIRYYEGDQPALFFHPSMAQVRIKRLLRGEPDLLLTASGAAPGDVILDCTAGLASDAIVFSYAAGPQGQVTALESERIPALLIHEGLSAYVSDIAELNAAMRRIAVKQAHHLDYLRQLEAGCVDIVYFDPMFRRPIEESSSISPLRGHANTEAVTAEALAHARRAARKCIVLKEHRDSKEFERLGFTQVLRSNTKTTYGVISLC